MKSTDLSENNDEIKKEEMLCRRLVADNFDGTELSEAALIDNDNDLSVDAKRNRTDEEMLDFQEKGYLESRPKHIVNPSPYMGFSELSYKDYKTLNFKGCYTPTKRNVDHCSLMLEMRYEQEMLDAAIEIKKMSRIVKKEGVGL